jgi:hypothetical protein
VGDSHDTHIERLEGEIEAMRPDLEAACDTFLDAIATCLADFWPGYIDSCISHAGDAVTEMGGDQLREVKEQVQEIQAKPKDVSREGLVENRRRIWPHLASIDDLVSASTQTGRGSFGWVGEVQSLSASRGHLPETLSKPIDEAAGVAAKPLQDANLPVPGARWEDPAPDISWTTAMIEAIQLYARIANSIIEKARELGQAREAREKDDALARWNKM